jgi:hypothetical protein
VVAGPDEVEMVEQAVNTRVEASMMVSRRLRRRRMPGLVMSINEYGEVMAGV